MNHIHFNPNRGRLVLVAYGEYADRSCEELCDALFESIPDDLFRRFCVSLDEPSVLMIELDNCVLFVLPSETHCLLQLVTGGGHLAACFRPPWFG